ncbi:MAG: hypothetical protein UU37_C0006G0009 [Candidatus Gottesmanbacteria bacterium GW2011_GWA2_41_12]|uniref:Uncharacterized protein n=3 Tax=Candidatus Gottesmaniibacteriota TaxID=1752720 RepID=A0A0G0XKW3_9BACT|nr:MAG: hypothetical protein UU37_C0006G0009 [Candidatus Gottesmanbacteria bacterium GW2011_GWA2_41_12]
MKTIVTHFTPDLDAIGAVWLLKRFLKGWDEAEVKYTAAGTTLNDEPVDSDADVLHVDTGFGFFDHHQLAEDTCATKLVFEHLRESQKSKVKSQKEGMKNFNEEALERLVEVVNGVDHFQEVYFPNPNADFYDFGLVAELDGWKLMYGDDYDKYVEHALICLDGIYRKFEDKVWAEKEIAEKGVEFKTKWGKAVGIETVNDEVIRIAQRTGYKLALRKDPKKGHVRIKSLPDPKIDLTPVYEKLKELDARATWFLHISRHMILNGSMKNPKSIPSKLSLKEIIEVIKKQVKS